MYLCACVWGGESQVLTEFDARAHVRKHAAADQVKILRNPQNSTCYSICKYVTSLPSYTLGTHL